MPPRKKGDRLAVGIAFGKRVRELREANGWTLEVLAETAKMNELQVGHIERGASDPKLSTMVKLAKAFGISLSDLFRNFK